MTIASLTLESGRNEVLAGARSAVYQRLAEALAYPSEHFLGHLSDGEWEDGLRGLFDELPVAVQVSACPSGIDGLAEGYVNVFEVGIGRPFCPLYEGSHRNGRLKLMEDLVRFYEHFGLKTVEGDQPDHVCAELEFMHYMAFKQAAALSHGEEARPLALAQRDFLDRHLCKWLPRVRSRLDEGRDVPEFYRWIAGLAGEFCRLDLLWLRSEA
jgi:DMSO reductase family type II enzyme chaperone